MIELTQRYPQVRCGALVNTVNCVGESSDIALQFRRPFLKL